MNVLRARCSATAAALAALLVSGCVSQPKPLYYWGDYQPQVYAYFKGDGESPEAQRLKLEATAEQAKAKGELLPPGFHAHLGLLYLNAGQAGLARQAFQTESAMFPESRPYMEFLLRKFDGQQG